MTARIFRKRPDLLRAGGEGEASGDLGDARIEGRGGLEQADHGVVVGQ